MQVPLPAARPGKGPHRLREFGLEVAYIYIGFANKALQVGKKKTAGRWPICKRQQASAPPLAFFRPHLRPQAALWPGACIRRRRRGRSGCQNAKNRQVHPTWQVTRHMAHPVHICMCDIGVTARNLLASCLVSESRGRGVARSSSSEQQRGRLLDPSGVIQAAVWPAMRLLRL
jgi:hypothetical protein